MKVSYIYFIQSGKTGPIKIGKANNPDSRMRELQIGNPYELRILALVSCKSAAHALNVEKKLHTIFRKKVIRGEWFHGDINISRAIGLANSVDCEYKEQEMKITTMHLEPEQLSHFRDMLN